MEKLSNDQIRDLVRNRYGRIADGLSASCCGGDTGCGCGSDPQQDMTRVSQQLGYSPKELAAVPKGANLGLGCGNPQAIGKLKADEIVLDLGSGAGFDCFLAANAVGSTGRVIGVDMTPEMLDKARNNATQMGVSNVEFRLGEIENLPVADNSVDVILSNCVINLSPDKSQVFREAMRVLKPGGRLAIADIVTTAELPPEVRADLDMLTGCVSGAMEIGALETLLAEIGFVDVAVIPQDESRQIITEWFPGRRIEDFIVSAAIQALKPI